MGKPYWRAKGDPYTRGSSEVNKWMITEKRELTGHAGLLTPPKPLGASEGADPSSVASMPTARL